MQRSLDLARQGSGFVNPNPRVGCVIVRCGKIIAEGFHRRFGGAHAEIEALKKINFKALGATLYVTLEPCAHFGKTPPCVDAVLASGVSRVVVAVSDPNPLVAGRALRKMRRAGIKVSLGCCKAEASELIRGFVKFITTKKPYIIGKIAMSLDGKISQSSGKRTQITGKESFQYWQTVRSEVSAVLVGKGTILADNPQLTVRDPKKHQPLHVILDTHLSLDPKKFRIFSRGSSPVILVHQKKVQKKFHYPKSVIFLECKIAAKKISLPDLFKRLGQMGIQSVLVEGGAETHASLLKSGCVDEFWVGVAPKILGEEGVAAFKKMPQVKVRKSLRLGEDLWLQLVNLKKANKRASLR